MNHRLFIIDDNPGDVELVRQALRELGAGVDISFATEGNEALRQLRGLAADGPEWLPGLILLDLNLIAQHGHEILRRIKAEPLLTTIPVAVYSSSRADQDMRLSHAAGAAACFAKPATYTEILTLMKVVANNWFPAAKPPHPTTP